MARYIKKNSPSGSLLNSHDYRKKEHSDIWTGPYLCANCDNVVFSQWENSFANSVWANPRQETTSWGESKNISFLVSLLYRVCILALDKSATSFNQQHNVYFRDLAFQALQNPSLVGYGLFLYPSVYEPINDSCQLIPGVNQLLNGTVFYLLLPPEPGLPAAYLLIFPKMMVLFANSDLSKAAGNELINTYHLGVGKPFNAKSNKGMPEFIYPILNKLVGESQAHQKSVGLFGHFKHRADRFLFSNKACYVAAKEDQKLLDWQKIHCSK